MDNRLVDFLTQLNQADTVDDAWACVVAFMESLGADYVNYGVIRPDGMVDYISTLPEWWMQQYVEEDLFKHDYLVHHCGRHLSPLVTGRNFDAERRDLSASAKMFMNAASDAGFHSVFSVPVRGITTPCSGGATISSHLKKEEFERILEKDGELIHIASLHAHIRIQHLLRQERAQAVKLSDRERECLTWLAGGLRVDRIAERMGLANVTVNLHMANARRKLGASTREQAVAAALDLGLIQP